MKHKWMEQLRFAETELSVFFVLISAAEVAGRGTTAFCLPVWSQDGLQGKHIRH